MKKYRIELKWVCALLLALTFAVASVGCVQNGLPQGEGGGDNPPAWASNFELPDADEALIRLNEIYGGEDKVFLLQKGRIARMPCPNGEVITVNAACEVGEYARLILNDCIEEFNEVFAAINPNYKFAINYAPDEADFAKKYSVRLTASDNLSVTETSETFGVAHFGYYNNFTELGDFGITIKREVFNNGGYLMLTFKHELMHLLGAGDAYKNPAATKDTVMQSYTVNGYHSLSSTDVALLDALYRNPEFKSDDERIFGYISAYEENSTHTKAALTAAVYRKAVFDLDPAEVTRQANEIGYKDLTEFVATVGGGIRPDPEFGTRDISFREIEYAETPSETYFGSIEPKDHRYWHGRQTSLGSSQGVTYVDYGYGVLYAAPNGSQYTIMIKTGDFVLAFRLSGGFTNFGSLSLALWHISK